MDRELTPEEIVELLPAYALDAVDDDERASVEAYLAEHAESRDEVAEFQVAASMLAHTGGPPPEGVWERLESIITDAPPPFRVVPPTGVLTRVQSAEKPRPDRWWRYLAAAAALAALAFGGLWIADRGGDAGNQVTNTAALARVAATAPGARHVSLTDQAGNTLATAVVLRDGTGYLTSQLPPVPGQTYQLWGITRQGTVSLGVLGPDPSTVAFHAAVPTQSLAITTEAPGGVPVSRNAPNAVGDVVTS